MPGLLAVDDEMIAPVFSPGGQRRQVGARVGLAVALAPANLATGDLWQVFELLRLGAELLQRRAQHPDAEALQRRAALQAAHLLRQNLGLFAAQPTSPTDLRPGRHGPAALRYHTQPLALRSRLELEVAAAPADLVFAGHGLAHLGRVVCLQPGAGLNTDGGQIGGIVEGFRSAHVVVGAGE